MISTIVLATLGALVTLATLVGIVIAVRFLRHRRPIRPVVVSGEPGVRPQPSRHRDDYIILQRSTVQLVLAILILMLAGELGLFVGYFHQNSNIHANSVATQDAKHAADRAERASVKAKEASDRARIELEDAIKQVSRPGVDPTKINHGLDQIEVLCKKLGC